MPWNSAWIYIELRVPPSVTLYTVRVAYAFQVSNLKGMIRRLVLGSDVGGKRKVGVYHSIVREGGEDCARHVGRSSRASRDADSAVRRGREAKAVSRNWKSMEAQRLACGAGPSTNVRRRIGRDQLHAARILVQRSLTASSTLPHDHGEVRMPSMALTTERRRYACASGSKTNPLAL